MIKLKIVVLALSISLLFGACGKKAAPKPPEADAPGPVMYLQVLPAVDSITLTWQRPEFQAEGGVLKDLQGFVVKKSVYERDQRAKFETVAEIAANDDGNGEEKIGQEKLAQGKIANESSVTGKTVVQYFYTDKDLEVGKQYEYLVLGVNEDGVEGLPSGVMRVSFSGESSLVQSFAPRAQ